MNNEPEVTNKVTKLSGKKRPMGWCNREIPSVELSEMEAKMLFSDGIETGRKGWKERIWHVSTFEKMAYIVGAARFFYGSQSGSEHITELPDGAGFIFQAKYTCD